MLQSLFHDGFVRVSFSHFGYEIILPHNPLYLLVIHLGESHFNASPAIFLLAFVEDFFDAEVVGVVPVRQVCGCEPPIVSASRYSREFAQGCHVVC